MARSAAGMQEETAGEAQKKKKPQADILAWFNQTIELATKGKQWSLQDIKELEDTGKESRMRQVRPAQTPITRVVPKRESEFEMTRPAIQAALKLAETFENASTELGKHGQRLRLDSWVNAGRMA
jgi:hypothetical protein